MIAVDDLRRGIAVGIAVKVVEVSFYMFHGGIEEFFLHRDDDGYAAGYPHAALNSICVSRASKLFHMPIASKVQSGITLFSDTWRNRTDVAGGKEHTITYNP